MDDEMEGGDRVDGDEQADEGGTGEASY